MFFKTGILNKFSSFTEKHLCWTFFLIKLQDFRPATLLKRDSNTGEICSTFKNTFFTEHFQWLFLCLLLKETTLSPEIASTSLTIKSYALCTYFSISFITCFRFDYSSKFYYWVFHAVKTNLPPFKTLEPIVVTASITRLSAVDFFDIIKACAT